MPGDHALRYARAASAAAIATAALLGGCFSDATSTSGGSSGSAGGGPVGSSSGGEAQPLLVDVDTNATLVTTPGQGIGVYLEYETGGHWRISWTCDTAITNLPCNFVVDASVATGAIANPVASGLGIDDAISQATPQQIEAVTTTTSGIDAMLFDASPGAAITVTVQLNAPVSFFFVQDNLVNGGYTGPLTNPLVLQPTTP